MTARGVNVRALRAEQRARVRPIMPREFALVALAEGVVEPRDPYLRCIFRARVVDRWVALAGERCDRAMMALQAALDEAFDAREELVSRCEIAEETLLEIAKTKEIARRISPWVEDDDEDKGTGT